ncbi:alpha/beta fold hydrolase [Paenibacillus alvei]|uniref:alpha/beta fold hydrolase n=1 Tax=Paenibacillus TaxID=44249 RepID=UPI00227DCDB5|nr:alpha/beta fold hydrolase [Paenibacillus alvei]
MSTYLLVHGAWDGGFVWREVASLLRQAGHDVYTPSLTGLGERTHLAHPDIDLHTFIEDIVGVFTYEQLEDVILVGHSFSGMVITGVAEIVPDRIKQLVYVDAMVPRHGESVATLSAPYLDNPYPSTADGDTPAFIAPPNLTDPRKSPMPTRSYMQELSITNERAAALPHIYIEPLDHPDSWPMAAFFRAMALRARDAGWRHMSLEQGGHWLMKTQPEPLSKLLLNL